ncbi:MAG: hypothetical protein ABIO70_18650 [Pseudomonadota bacterium]
MPLATLLLLLVRTALANPVVCDWPGHITLASDGHHAVASFRGCGRTRYYARHLCVQAKEGDAWVILDGQWVFVGGRVVNDGSGRRKDNAFEQRVACPADGPQTFRVAWDCAEEASAWFEGSVTCGAPAPEATPAAPETTGCAAPSGRAGSASWMTAALALLARRQRL